MTLHEKVVLSTYTGILMCDFSEVHKYIEKLLSWLRRPYGRRSRKSKTRFPQNHRVVGGPFMAKVKPKVVLYLCDRKRCGDRCHYPDCRHTTDISHAVHGGAFPDGFEKVKHGDEIYFTEKEN